MDWEQFLVEEQAPFLLEVHLHILHLPDNALFFPAIAKFDCQDGKYGRLHYRIL
jgi:hypothetical protein